MEDSDARVSGRGFEQLRNAGIAVETGLCAQEAAQLNAGFFLKTQFGRPLLTLKLALTLDGRIATRTGDSQWITGPNARRAVHMMRRCRGSTLDYSGEGLQFEMNRVGEDASSRHPSFATVQ